MQFYPFRPTHSPKMHITYEQILKAMKEAGKDSSAHDTGKKYAVMNPTTGDTFSPKDILRRIIGDKCFYGGKGFGGANEVFHAFGFPLGKKEKLKSRLERLQKKSNGHLRIDELIGRLFSQQWRVLPSKRELKDIEHSDCPGVYVLAYSDGKLSGKRIQEKDVFYVGMTAEGGLGYRLGQFRQGIERGGPHSAGERFFRIWLRRKPYKPNGKYCFYFSYLPIECETDKEWRTLHDLRNLGKVAELEYAVMAHVKNTIGHEPLLNKK